MRARPLLIVAALLASAACVVVDDESPSSDSGTRPSIDGGVDVPASTVTDASTGDSQPAAKDATASVTAPPGTWARVPTGTAEAVKQTWYNLAYDTKRKVFYGISWMKVLSAFDPVTGQWTALTAGTVGDFHNRTIAYDPLNDRLWVSDGTGSGGAFQYFDFASNTFVPVPIWAPSYEAVILYDPAGKRFVTFGGWQASNVMTLDLQAAGSTWQSVAVPGGGPAYVSDAQKFTAWRAAVDTTRKRIVYVDTDGSVWALPFDLSGWQHIATTGTAPPALTQYVYDAAADALVGWNPSLSAVAGDGFPPTQQTFFMPIATPVWQKGANKPAGNVVPIHASYVGFAMGYDPENHQTVLHTTGGNDEYSPETWVYKYPAP